jgi:TRAP-type C4-dicarboxylate transport system permease small subunit
MKPSRTGWFYSLSEAANSVSKWFEWVGITALAAMVLITLIDVVGSKSFNWPFPGSTELIAVIQVVAIAGGLASSKIDNRHIRIELFVNKLYGRSKAALEIFNSVLGIGFFAVAAAMTFKYGLSMFHSGTVTMLIRVSLYPFAFWISLCCILMCCVLALELTNFVGALRVRK